jgi:hypothetical protein
MGDGVNIPGGVRFQAPVQETNTVDEAKPTEVKDKPTATPYDESPRSTRSPDWGGKKDLNDQGIRLKENLNTQLDRRPVLSSESMKAADKILTNPRLSNEAKIAELQKMIGKTDKAEFQKFMKSFSDFPENEQQLINSAITESETIMGRIGSELPQNEQLKIVQDAVMNPLKGKTPKEEQKRLDRFDKGVSEWMSKTDTDTLDKALDGKSINIKASAKLYGSMATMYPRIVGMFDRGKIMGDKMEIATAVMNAKHNQQHPASREEQEGLAASMILHNIGEEERRRPRQNELQ